MILCGKQFPSTVTVFLLTLTLTTGHEGQNENLLQPSSSDDLLTNNNNNTLNVGSPREGNSSVDYDYNWDNTDHDYANDEPSSDDNLSVKPTDEGLTLKEPDSKSLPLKSTAVNGTVPEKEIISDNSTKSSESISSMTQSGSTASEIKGSELPHPSSSEFNPSSDPSLSPSTTRDFSSTPTSENENSTSTERVSPSAITTQDLGDVSNYTSTIGSELDADKIDPAGFKTWAVVVVSVLISFAAIFTLLFIIRRELIRRRKADQRRLLRGSISSEGYFYGDGDGNTSGKFEL